MAKMKPSLCPKCKMILNGATHLQDVEKSPRPGDVTVCVVCAEVLVFDDDLMLRRPLVGEIDENDPELQRHVIAVKTLRGLPI